MRAPRPADVPPPAGELWGLVAQLPQRQREVAVLRYVADLREEEIAEVLSVTRSTVSTTLRAALRRAESRSEGLGSVRATSERQLRPMVRCSRRWSRARRDAWLR